MVCSTPASHISSLSVTNYGQDSNSNSVDIDDVELSFNDGLPTPDVLPIADQSCSTSLCQLRSASADTSVRSEIIACNSSIAVAQSSAGTSVKSARCPDSEQSQPPVRIAEDVVNIHAGQSTSTNPAVGCALVKLVSMSNFLDRNFQWTSFTQFFFSYTCHFLVGILIQEHL